jgi:hypothetical protein
VSNVTRQASASATLLTLRVHFGSPSGRANDRKTCRKRSMQIEQLAELTQEALDAYHRAETGVELARRLSTFAPHLQQLVGIVKP